MKSTMICDSIIRSSILYPIHVKRGRYQVFLAVKNHCQPQSSPSNEKSKTFNLEVSNTLDLIRELLVSLFHLSTQPVPLSQLNIGHVWPRLLLPCLKVRSVYENFIKNISEGLRRRCLGSISVIMINFEILYTIILDHVLRCSKQVISLMLTSFIVFSSET